MQYGPSLAGHYYDLSIVLILEHIEHITTLKMSSFPSEKLN